MVLTMNESVSCMSDERISAIHESGHAVALCYFGPELLWVKIGIERLANGDLIGGMFMMKDVVLHELAKKDEQTVVEHMVLFYAGPEAEDRINPEAMKNGKNISDRQSAGKISSAYCDPCNLPKNSPVPDIKAIHLKAREATQLFVSEHWPEILAVADVLQTKKRLTGDEIKQIILDLREKSN